MPPLPRRYLLPATLVATLALLLAWRQPWRILTASPTPISTFALPAPQATGTLARVPLPIVTPATSAAPRPTPPATPATPAASGNPVAPTGILLYLGVVDGRPGIVAINADGTGRRLLAPGVYIALAWSPDGVRFAALGGNGYEQLAIFAADGRPLARYPLRASTQCDLRWSPDSRRVICIPAYPFNGTERTTIVIVDDFGLREALIPTVVRAEFLGWPAPNLLGLVGYPEEWPSAAAEILGIALPLGEVRSLTQGDFLPLGWSADTGKLLALGGRQPRGGAVSPGTSVFTELIAIDIDTGERRTLERADRVTRVLTGTAPGYRYWFNGGVLSPNSYHLALWVAREPTTGTPPPGTATDLILTTLTLNELGTPSAITTVRPAAGSNFTFGWSPFGQQLALPLPFPDAPPALLLLDRSTPVQLTYPLGYNTDPSITWSPDGRWFAYISPTGLAVAATSTTNSSRPPPTLPLDPTGRAPAWRPGIR